METEKLVSAIITTKNRLSLLIKALESIKAQTYPNIECIIVDDGSNDGTEEYCKNRPDIIYIKIPPKESKGGNYARNIGIHHSHGTYIAFCDDDDTWQPTKIEKQISMMLDNNNLGLVYCGVKYNLITSNKNKIINITPDYRNRGNLSSRILYTIPCVTSTILIKRAILDQIGYFDENLKFWQEYELTIRVCQISSIDFVQEYLVNYLADFTDNHRLTNKYIGWKEAVKYIKSKHKNLYSKQKFHEKWLTQLLIIRDAKTRLKNQKGYTFIKILLLNYILLFPCIPSKYFSKRKSITLFNKKSRNNERTN